MNNDVKTIGMVTFKIRVRRLHKALKKYEPSIKLGHSYDLLSRLHGYSGWHELHKRMVLGNELVDIVRDDLPRKAEKLHSLLQSRTDRITVEECHDCLRILYGTRKEWRQSLAMGNHLREANTTIN